MGERRRFPATLLVCLLLPLLTAAQPAKPPAPAAGAAPATGNAKDFGVNLNTGDEKKPVQIDADQGLEWRQDDHVYIARGNAKVTRGNATVYADTLIAHYRPSAKPAGTPAPATDKANDPTGDTEIYSVEAEGHVRMATDTQTLYADHAVYDLDQGIMVATGKNLKMVTPQETVTARDSLEWHDHDQVAVARGNAVAIRDQKELRADVIIAAVTRDAKGAQHVSRVDAQGNVMVTSQDQIGHGDSGVFNADTGIVTLIGHVRLTRGSDELHGQYAVVDTKHNVSRLLSELPGPTLAGQPRRVEGLLVPPQSSQAGKTKK